MDVLGQLAGGFAAALSPTNLLMAALGALLGTLVGVLPGLGPTAAIAILFPLTTVLAPVPNRNQRRDCYSPFPLEILALAGR